MFDGLYANIMQSIVVRARTETYLITAKTKISCAADLLGMKKNIIKKNEVEQNQSAVYSYFRSKLSRSVQYMCIEMTKAFSGKATL